MAICGIKTSTPLKPATTPSISRSLNGPAGKTSRKPPCIQHKQIFNKRHGVRRPGKYRLEHKQQYAHENNKAKYFMGKYLIYLVAMAFVMCSYGRFYRIV
jgi:hypothetical protein